MLTRVITGRRTKWVVLLLWLLIMGGVGSLSGKLTGAENNEPKAWLPASAESTKALDVQAALIPAEVFPAVLVYQRDSGLTDADRAKITADIAAFKQRPDIHGPVNGPVFSADGKAVEAMLPIDLGSSGWSKSHDVVKELVARAGNSPGLSAHVTGPLGTASDTAQAFGGIDGVLLLSTIGVVILILLLTYRSPFLWVLPVLCGGLALVVAQGVVYLLAKDGHLVVNGQSAGILTVLVFGAGTDYALLLVARYREELRRVEDRHEAMAIALRRAGPAVLASSATVTISMLCLLFAEMNSTKGLGPVLAVGVVVALIAMLTLLPALLVVCGRWLFWPVRPKVGTVARPEGGLWGAVGRGIARHPRPVWIVTAVILAGLTVGATQMHPDGLSNKQLFRGTPDSIVGEQVVTDHFPAGAGNPVFVVAKPAAADAVRAALAGTKGIAPDSVTPVRQVAGWAYLEGTLTAAPDSQAGQDIVDDVRTAVHAVPGAEAKVGGPTAIALDTQRASARDVRVILPIVLLVVFLILTLLLRALVASVLLMITVVLSFGAAIGISAVVFKSLLGVSNTDPSFPLYLFVFLVALGIDYNIFLMTRVREEATRRPAREAAVVGLAATGGVITSAGLVLAATFVVLGTLPLISFAQIGISVAIGVLLDTIIVRSILVTALNLDFGAAMWWPSRPGRGLPSTGGVPPVDQRVAAPVR